MSLTFDELTQASKERRETWHPADTTQWTGADWSNATMGEVGELVEVIELLAISSALTRHGGIAANLVKKIRRHETGLSEKIPQSALLEELAKEMADVVGYLVVLADHYDIDLGEAVALKFNEVSAREGLPQRLPTKNADALRELVEELEAEVGPPDPELIKEVIRALDGDEGQGWTCQCSHNSMRHDRVQTRTIYPCTECNCTNMVPADEE